MNQHPDGTPQADLKTEPGGPTRIATDLAHIRAVIDHLPQLAWTCLPDGYADYLNRRWVEYTGVPEAEHHGRGWLTAVHPDDREHTRAVWDAFVAGRAEYDVEYRLRRHDGEYRWFKTRGVLVRDEHGAPVRVFGTTTDIDDQKRAEERLRLAQERSEQQARSFDATLSAVRDYVFVFTPDARFAYANRALFDLWGRTPEESIGKSLEELDYPEPDRVRIRANIRRVVETREPVFDRIAYTGASGTSGYFEYILAPVLDAAGEVVQVAGTSRDVTEQVRAAEERERLHREVETERQRLADVFQHAPSLMCVLRGPEHVFERANDRYHQLVGHRDLVGKTVREALPEVAGQGFFELLDRVYSTGEPYHGNDVRLLLQREPGHPPEERYVDFVYQALFGPDGAVTGILAQGVDLTDRRLAEERLRENEAWLQKVTDSLPALVSYIDRDLVYRFVNRAYEEWFGTPAAQVVGKTVPEVLGEANFVQRRSYVEAALRGERVRFEGPTIHATLGVRETELIYTPYRPDGEVLGFFVHGLDITERREAERAKREAEERLELAVEIAQMGTFVIDLETDAVTANEPGRAIYGWPSVHTTFTEVQAHFHPDDKDRVLQVVGAAFDPAGPGRFEVEQRIVRTDGEERWIRVRGQAIFEGRGDARRAVRCIGTYLDVTDSKRKEEALRDADRKKDEFLALLAHELRNPLAPLRNGLQVMRLAGKDAEVSVRARDMMERQLTHMVRLVDDLLDVSRITRGKMELRRKRVLLSDVVASAVETARPSLDAAGHGLSVSMPSETIYLDGDLTRLAQVFSNLLTNSAKYTPPGGEVRLAAELDGGEVVVRVQDTGIGIPADALPRIFDMFSQVDRPNQRSAGGLGIGLALVHGLVGMHGGTVTAESEGEGHGSTFTVRLPLSDYRPSPLPAARPDSHPAAGGPRRKVLVVDDNRDSAHSMAEMLSLLGHDVRTAHDGAEAVAAAEAFRPEVILMDIGMPVMNGYDATRAIRERPWGREVIILALTGWGQEADRAESKRAGCDGHLVKPVHLEALEPFLSLSRKA